MYNTNQQHEFQSLKQNLCSTNKVLTDMIRLYLQLPKILRMNLFQTLNLPERRTGIFLSLPDFHQGQCTQHPEKGNNKVTFSRTTNYTLNDNVENENESESELFHIYFTMWKMFCQQLLRSVHCKLYEKQPAKKDVPDSLELLHFTVRPVDSVLHLSAGQVYSHKVSLNFFCEEIQITELLLQEMKFLGQE